LSRIRAGGVLALVTVVCVAATRSRDPGGLTLSQLTPTTTLIVGPTGNMVALTGFEGTVLIGTQAQSLTPALRTALAAHGAPPVRWVIATAGDSAWTAGDAGWSVTGATVLMHEKLAFAREHRASDGRELRQPRIGFSEVVQLLVDSDAIHAVHQRTGADWAEVSVHIEGARVLYLGQSFTTDGYPAIDPAHGGSLDSLIATADNFTGFSSTVHMVPGRGPVGTVRELHAYRDMLAAVRDKLHPFIAANRPVAEVVASHPTAAFDATWGHGPVSPQAFVAAAYGSLLPQSKK
jgi:hypothetical protein